MADLANKLKAAAKDGVQKSAPVTTFVGMNSVQIGSFLQENYALQIAQLLPVTNKLSAERIIAQATMVIAQNEGLKNCTPQSVIGGIMTAAMFGLNPLPALNQCFFIPYQENKQDSQGNWHKISVCQFQMGYAGVLKMLYNTGLVEYIVAEAVHIEDKFENIRGTDAKIVHVPCNKMVTQDTILGAYCVIKLKGFGHFEMYLPKERIEHLRKKGSRGKNELSGAWKTDYGAMSVVKAIKAACKKLPFSDEMLNKSFESDDEVFDITAANMATKELIPVSTEDTENVEAVEVVEVQEVLQINPQNIGNDTEFYKWFEWAKQNPLIEFNHDTTQEIVRRILIGEIDIKEVPNEWLSSKAIENAVLTAEQKDKYIGKDK